MVLGSVFRVDSYPNKYYLSDLLVVKLFKSLIGDELTGDVLPIPGKS